MGCKRGPVYKVVTNSVEVTSIPAPDKLEQFSRYEVHLDRKLDCMLSLAPRLKELRKRRFRTVPFDKDGSAFPPN